jgi:hypothetical protein
LVSAVIHPVGRAKRERERVAAKKKRDTKRDRQNECRFKRTATYYVGLWKRERERETIDVEYRLQ